MSGWGGDMYVKLMRDEGLGWLVEAGTCETHGSNDRKMRRDAS